MKGKQIFFERRDHAVLKDVDEAPHESGQIVIENDYAVISAGTERANVIQLPDTVTRREIFRIIQNIAKRSAFACHRRMKNC